ncbi:MAG: hypothetical protein JXA57_16250 [Armatimonadetes bacterium]|nr:hypothetical protein [Armatimonadota bacterium]
MAQVKAKKDTKASREERVQGLMALTGFSRTKAEQAIDIADGTSVGDFRADPRIKPAKKTA